MTMFPKTKKLIIALVGIKVLKRVFKKKSSRKGVFKILTEPMKTRSSTPR